MSEEIKRVKEMLLIAAAYIEYHCPSGKIEYDETTCDGYCVANDCKIAAEMLTEKAGDEL